MWHVWWRVEVRTPEGNNHLEDLGADGTIILKLIFKKYEGGVVWIYLAKNRYKYRALLNTVMNLQFQYNAGNFLTN